MDLLVSLAHGVEAAADGQHIPLWTGLLLSLGASLGPFLLGWYGGRRPLRQDEFLAGVAAGLLLYLFIDFFGLTGNLGMSLGNLALQGALLTIFVGAILLCARLEVVGSFAAASLWAAGIGLHALGEGIIMGYNLHQGWGMVLAPLPLLSFFGHKVAEGFTLGLLPGGRPWVLLALGALPAVLGTGLGFLGLPGLVSNFAYAGGAGAVAWVVLLFLRSTGNDHWRRALGLATGFAIMYLVGVLHEF